MHVGGDPAQGLLKKRVKFCPGVDRACVARTKLRCAPDMCDKNLVWAIKEILVYDWWAISLVRF